MPYSAFGTFLSDRLRSKGWSQRHFATLVGVNQAQLGRIMRGARRPPLEQLGAWGETLALDPASARDFARLALVAHQAGWLAALIPPAHGRRAAEDASRYDQSP